MAGKKKKPSKTRGKELEGQGRNLAYLSRGQGTGATLSKKERLDAGRGAAKALIAGRREQTLAKKKTKSRSKGK